jgi:hypothetical protein
VGDILVKSDVWGALVELNGKGDSCDVLQTGGWGPGFRGDERLMDLIDGRWRWVELTG